MRDIRLPLGAGDDMAVRAALKVLGISRGEAAECRVARASPDLRHLSHPTMVFTVSLDLPAEREEELAAHGGPTVIRRTMEPFCPQPGTERLPGRPVVAGFGPAGMFAGLLLARLGYRPLIVERGTDVDSRVRAVEGFWQGLPLDPQTNVQFGEGGAGTFSDGKLTTRIHDPLCQTVMDEFIRHGAPEEIRRLAKPHIGTDRLRGVVKAIRRDILDMGGEIRFGTTLTGLTLSGGRLTAAALQGGETVETGALILAVGHSARDTFAMLRAAGVRLASKPFSAGVRIEHRQSDIDRALYGPLAGDPRLPPGEYQLSLRRGEDAVYTFCMCPGGAVVAAASEEGGIVVNGMSEYARDGENANSALVVSVGGFADAMEGVAFQRSLEQAAFTAGGRNYAAPVQTVGAFRRGSETFLPDRVQPTYPRGVAPTRLDQLFPPRITGMLRLGLQAFDRRLPGFAAEDALLTGVETRTSSPLRIPRGEGMTAEGIEGLYPAGEGAGYAGGIMSAAMDGLRAGQAIVTRFRPAD